MGHTLDPTHLTGFSCQVPVLDPHGQEQKGTVSRVRAEGLYREPKGSLTVPQSFEGSARTMAMAVLHYVYYQ